MLNPLKNIDTWASQSPARGTFLLVMMGIMLLLATAGGILAFYFYLSR